jgi:hypothetical protein
MTEAEILAGAMFYARASAYRALYGTIPPRDPAADAANWRRTRPSVRREMLEMVRGIVGALPGDESEKINLVAERLASWLRPRLDAKYVAACVLKVLEPSP